MKKIISLLVMVLLLLSGLGAAATGEAKGNGVAMLLDTAQPGYYLPAPLQRSSEQRLTGDTAARWPHQGVGYENYNGVGANLLFHASNVNAAGGSFITDWTGYTTLNMYIYNPKQVAETYIHFFAVDGDNIVSGTPYAYFVNYPLDWEGWKLVSIPLGGFTALSGNELNDILASVQTFRIAIRGYKNVVGGNNETPSEALLQLDEDLYLSDIWLSDDNAIKIEESKISFDDSATGKAVEKLNASAGAITDGDVTFSPKSSDGVYPYVLPAAGTTGTTSNGVRTNFHSVHDSYRRFQSMLKNSDNVYFSQWVYSPAEVSTKITTRAWWTNAGSSSYSNQVVVDGSLIKGWNLISQNLKDCYEWKTGASRIPQLDDVYRVWRGIPKDTEKGLEKLYNDPTVWLSAEPLSVSAAPLTVQESSVSNQAEDVSPWTRVITMKLSAAPVVAADVTRLTAVTKDGEPVEGYHAFIRGDELTVTFDDYLSENSNYTITIGGDFDLSTLAETGLSFTTSAKQDRIRILENNAPARSLGAEDAVYTVELRDKTQSGNVYLAHYEGDVLVSVVFAKVENGVSAAQMSEIQAGEKTKLRAYLWLDDLEPQSIFAELQTAELSAS